MERDRPAVVFVHDRGSRCSGALIGERLVLTAKHCVQRAFDDSPSAPEDISVGVGYSALQPDMEFYRVVDVVVAGGAYEESEEGGVENLLPDDVAVLTLQRSPDVRPLGLDFADPRRYRGEVATAVGFGQTPGDAVGGIKLSVETLIRNVDDEALWVDATVCPGDSGGPLITDDDTVVGVVSSGIGNTCGVGLGFYNRIDLHEELIMQAFARAGEVPGHCIYTGDETCDGFDNDCDDGIDEGCLALGSECSEDAECIGASCEDTPMGRLCTARCDPLNPELACPDGLRCVNSGACEGLCVPGSIGGKSFDESCEEDDECASLFCADPGDGRKRCLSACRSGTDSCFSDEACIARDGACGPCARAELVSSKLGFGEPCDGDERCRSGRCLEDGALAYCSAACETHDDCPETGHCRDGDCVRGARARLGGYCLSHDDCAAGLFCSSEEREGFCTRTCETVADCGDGFACDAVRNGDACVPRREVLGGRCEADGDCISLYCDPDTATCTRVCAQNAACGAGFHCVRRKSAADGVCIAGDVTQGGPDTGGGSAAGDGGCGAAAPLGAGGGGWGVGLLSAILALRRRGRRS